MLIAFLCVHLTRNPFTRNNNAQTASAGKRSSEQMSAPTLEGDLLQVDNAIDELLSKNDPASTPKVAFRGAQYDAGLAWPHLPRGCGGLGVRPSLARHVEQRLHLAGAAAADPATFFMHLAAPTIATHGSDEQKHRFLRPMFTGEERWCQLFSEPGAGSDIAGLSTRAKQDGDEWLVNGQKVWNTLAHLADWGMLVTRSAPALPKHKGLTYFAVNMYSEGLEIRPLRQLTGEAEFNEVYLTDVRVPDTNRIGRQGDGWRVLLTTLMNERQAIGAGTVEVASVHKTWAVDDALSIWSSLDETQRTRARRHGLMQLLIRGEIAKLTNKRANELADAGNPGPEMSVAKLEMAAFNKALYSFCLDLLGADGMVGFDYTFRRPGALDPTGTRRRAARLLASTGKLHRGRDVRNNAQHHWRASLGAAWRATGR